MVSLLKNMPIYRRLFLAFFLAVVIPDVIMIVLGSVYMQVLNAHGMGTAQTGPLILGTAIALLLSTGIVITLGFLVNVTITQPLQHLVSLTRRVSQGETEARVPVAGRDEIAIVARSMNTMLDHIIRLAQEAQGQRDRLQAQVEKLVEEVSGVGEGDLRIQAEVTSDALGVLADSFNYMVEELSSLVVRVKMVAQEVEASATSTFMHMAELVQNADIQIQQMGMATKQVEQMTRSSQRAAEKVQILEKAASEARLFVRKGLDIVQRTVEGMTHINTTVQETTRQVLVLEDRSREINEIVDVIAGIVNSTNRLALDAAIQAAMAGEHGKGFLAVADGIRRLAEQAKAQAGLITQILRSVREDIKTAAVSMRETAGEASEGTVLVEETGTAFQQIYALVEQQAREIEVIHQEVRTLFQSANTVAQIVQGVSGTTRQSSEKTRNVAQRMEILARQARQLLKSVEAFKLREETQFSIAELPMNASFGQLMSE
ncbi:MAG: methyl-accepting chemotaxis protein [Ktedonobacteraceae bacterium]|nr:methyl-accepting chemotaxis protein [Ktedonobacteraceae bacterium]